jgi:hypothetical protein
MVFFLRKIEQQARLSPSALSAIHSSTLIMSTITETDRIEVVVHRVPEAKPQWILEPGPVQSPLPIQYTFSEPKQHHTLVQWLLAFLKIR